MSKDTTELELDCRKSRSLTAQIACFLEQELKDGLYPKGSKLPSEANLIQRYGVSRTVIREALRYLQAKDLITIQHGIGAISKGWPEPVENRLLNPLKNHYTELEAIELNSSIRVFRALIEGLIKLSILTRDDTCKAELTRMAQEVENESADFVNSIDIMRQHLEFYQIMSERCEGKILSTLTRDVCQGFRYFFDHPDQYGPFQKLPLRAEFMKDGLQSLMMAIVDGKEEVALRCFNSLADHTFGMLETVAKQEVQKK